MRSSLAASLLCCLFTLPGTAMALTVPTVNTAVSFSGNPNSVQFTGGAPKYLIYRSYSVDAGATWSPPVPVARNTTGLYVHYSVDSTKWWRYTARSLDESTNPDTVSGPTVVPFIAPNWRVGNIPLSDAGAAAYVITQVPEIRGPLAGRTLTNTAENLYVPTTGPGSEIEAFQNTHLRHDPEWPTNVEYNPYYEFVTGNSTLTNPSTGDLIQWAAHKWGIPADIFYAMAYRESAWFQDAMGDDENVGQAVQAQHPAQARFNVVVDGVTQYWVYESMGITQIKWRPDGYRGAGTEPLRWKSTAWNLDYAGANARYYADGLCDWCDDDVVASFTYPGSGVYPASSSKEWMSIGAHFEPSPWGNGSATAPRSGQLGYIANNRDTITARSWTTQAFKDRLAP